MVTPHDWSECRPATLKLGEPGTPAEAAVINAAVEGAFAEMNDAGRKAFHRLCCENARDPFTMILVSRYQRRIQELLPEHLR